MDVKCEFKEWMKCNSINKQGDTFCYFPKFSLLDKFNI